MNKKTGNATLRLTISAVLMAMTIVLSSFSIPVPGGHLYLCDVTIALAGIMLNPFEAFVVGGIGSFLGDMIFYPTPMFVSLVTHGLQGIVVSLISHRLFKKHTPITSGIGVTVGAVIMVLGYTLGKIYVYSTFEYAMIKLPYEILQAVVGAVAAMVLYWKCGIRKIFNKMINSNS